MTSPEMLREHVKNSDQEQAIREGKIITFQITEELLPIYQRLAKINDLKLTVIGQSGDNCYVTKKSFFREQRSKQKDRTIPHLVVRPKPVETRIPDGVVAISFDRPLSTKTYETFERKVTDLKHSVMEQRPHLPKEF